MKKLMLAAIALAATTLAPHAALAGRDLDAIRARGSLICGVGLGTAGFMLADSQGIEFVYQVCAFLPLLGLLTVFLPDIEHRRRA